MSIQNEIPPSVQPPNAGEAVRAIFRKHARKLNKVLLTRGCHRMMEQHIRQQTAILQALKREARRKKPSKDYKKFTESMLAGAATAEVGSFSQLTANDLATFEQVLDGIVNGMAGKPALPKIQGKAFVSMQKKIFVQPEKRGPKYRPNFDEAFLRHVRGEEVSSIAREMDPRGFAADPDQCMEKFRKAFKRRRRLL